MQSIISKCQETPILTLYSKDTKYEALDTETESHFSHKFLDTINDPGVPPHTLKLQEGDICFLTRNIVFKDGNTGLYQNKRSNRVLSPSSPQDGPKTKPGTSGTHRGPRGNVPVAYVPGTSIWGSVGVLEVARFRAKS